MAFLATVAMYFKVKTLWLLIPIVYCFAVINLILQTVLATNINSLLVQDIGLFIHVGLALFAYALCFMTMLYAIQLFWLDRNLKRKNYLFLPLFHH